MWVSADILHLDQVRSCQLEVRLILLNFHQLQPSHQPLFFRNSKQKSALLICRPQHATSAKCSNLYHGESIKQLLSPPQGLFLQGNYDIFEIRELLFPTLRKTATVLIKWAEKVNICKNLILGSNKIR